MSELLSSFPTEDQNWEDNLTRKDGTILIEDNVTIMVDVVTVMVDNLNIQNGGLKLIQANVHWEDAGKGSMFPSDSKLCHRQPS